ncbi:hypothetical protein K490DRAFT_42326 [Saccharata proteae CBS 121410]|uniref:Protein N-terminal and lysine N-methyltransferase EFM7 n=1 Tax=Saccharata proteae CBS 121410 TaxID=1314787 RepID=A0A9P4HVL2_9PEZI|nr:hypothetical protein K490DRAFT_42326 [Saccharata proteae CBS 121410]
MSSDAGSEAGGLDLFQEPADYFEPEKPATFATHRLANGEEVTVRLVGFNPLWGHHVWQAGRIISTYLESRAATFITDKSVLEFGAGAGLPSLVCALKGANTVVVTDYPDADLIENLEFNVKSCCKKRLEEESGEEGRRIVARGYLWGADPTPLLSFLHTPPQSSPTPGFDTLILADLLFNHSEHAKLIASVASTLRRSADAVALVFFSPYRPWLLEKDVAFFDLARERGFRVEKVWESVMEKVMFEEDRGDERLRRTVFGFELRWGDLVGEDGGGMERGSVMDWIR